MESWLEAALRATQSWFADHGWRILLILFLADATRRFGMIFIGKLIERSINKSERFENDRDRKLRSDTVISMVGSILKATMWAVVILIVASELNILRLLLPLMAVGGVLSLLLGFGIQTFVKDFISGVFIVVENQYRVGDIVSLTANVGGAVEGRVIRITLRTTVLRDEDGSIHFIPNGNITRSSNLTLDYAKVNIPLTLPFAVDFEALGKSINSLGKSMQQEDTWRSSIIEAPYYHGVQSMSEDKVVVEVRAKTLPAEQWTIASELQKRLAELIHTNKSFAAKDEKKSKKSK